MAAPLRILFVSHSFPPPDHPLANIGGMQRVATELDAALAHHPDVAYHHLVLRTSWRWTHVRVIPFLCQLLLQIPRHVARHDTNVVLFSSMVTASLAILLRRQLHTRGIRLVAIAHGRDVTLPVMPYQRLLPHVFEHLDAVLAVSRATGAACQARGLPSERLYVIPNGIDPSRFARPIDRQIARHELCQTLGLSLPDQALLLCSVGRQVPRKGFAWFVDTVMPRLPTHIHYWLAGDGPDAAAIEKAIARHHLQQRVHRLGRVPDDMLHRLYRAADLFIMPNRPVPGDMEGFGVVMLEAALCGTPVLAARLEGIQDVVTEDKNGHLIESGNATGFVRWILHYDQDRSALQQLSEQAATYVRTHFSWDVIADRYVQTLRAICSTVPSAPATFPDPRTTG
ncbi:MAG: glycosyltransferase family 4 protein [Rhodothermus sp.]|nr:glycosyltransferase family 4 protein [Rhodothermus sp.]